MRNPKFTADTKFLVTTNKDDPFLGYGKINGRIISPYDITLEGTEWYYKFIAMEVDSMIRWYIGLTERTIMEKLVDKTLQIVEYGQKKCTCKLHDLVVSGCSCGGI